MKYSSLLSFPIFFDLGGISLEIFNISGNNIISVGLAKVLGYLIYLPAIYYPAYLLTGIVLLQNRSLRGNLNINIAKLNIHY
jgi:hypothetical protein